MMIAPLLHDQVTLVTGAAQGIGRAIAEAYAEAGAHVLLGDIHLEQAKAVAEALAPHSTHPPLALRLDVSDPTSVTTAFALLDRTYGRIDVLVNNAAVLRAHLVVDFPLAAWQEVFRVNMEGTFLCSQAAVRRMIGQRRGCIINIASASARKADSKHAAYSASKAALLSFTRVLALEVGEYGIRVNAICPGATETEMLRGVFEQVPGIREQLIGRTVLGKLGQPRDQANAAVFLASDLASHITGEYLIVSGGEFMNA
jgi:NAD(P)-dependent dehydrogenase (short-subunit alcohol dehydrogenase family)